MALGNSLAKKYRWVRSLRIIVTWAVLFYLRFWAIVALLSFRGKSIGVAGAVGKSTTRNALDAILSYHKPTRIVTGNSETGIPLGILHLSIGTYRLVDWLRVVFLAPFRIFNLRSITYLVVEMGIDGPNPPKNMAYLLTIIAPQIGILVNESPAHTENYETGIPNLPIEDRLEMIVKKMTEDDGLLLKNPHLHTAIVNIDNPYIKEFSCVLPKNKIRTVGTQKFDDIFINHHEVTATGTHFEFSLHSYQIDTVIPIIIVGFVLPKEVGIALGSAILACVAMGIPLSTIRNNLQTYFSLPPGRGSIFEGISKSTIFDSSYNASSASVISFITLLKSIKYSSRRPITFVFGDMKELGIFSQYEHEKVAKELPGVIDHLLLVGPLTKQFVLPLAQKHQTKFRTILHFEKSQEAGVYLREHLPQKSIVLVKGSQLLEEAIKYIVANRQDTNKLCRQDLFWEKTKKLRGQWATSF